MIGVSLFSSAGIAETYLRDVGINIVVANELIKERSELYQACYPDAKMINGNILDDNIFKSIVNNSPKKIDFLIASPPCQGMSMAGKNRSVEQMRTDQRNYLVFKIIDFIKIKSPDYVLIENVPAFLKITLPYNGMQLKVVEILEIIFGKNYNVKANVYDSSEYGVAQRRTRAIIKLYPKTEEWTEPKKSKLITVEEKIGHLPSIEAGQSSNVLWHFARKHSKNHIEWMKHTPTGKSAFENVQNYPIKSNGEKIKSYMTTYRRIKWDEPAPTITMRNDAISSQLNVHPGRYLENNLYSDARVLTPLELMLLSSLPENWNIPKSTPELLVRKCIGECIPPLLIKKIVSQLNCL
jgi:DNA (cytosine-5)-methyltransferase 1